MNKKATNLTKPEQHCDFQNILRETTTRCMKPFEKRKKYIRHQEQKYHRAQFTQRFRSVVWQHLFLRNEISNFLASLILAMIKNKTTKRTINLDNDDFTNLPYIWGCASGILLDNHVNQFLHGSFHLFTITVLKLFHCPRITCNFRCSTCSCA